MEFILILVLLMNVCRCLSKPTLPNFPAISLRHGEDNVVLDNGLIQVTLLSPTGEVEKVQYNGIENLLEEDIDGRDRGYWDIELGLPNSESFQDRLECSSFQVIVHTSERVEISFTRKWNSSIATNGYNIPFDLDKRYVMLQGSSGFYTYAIFTRGIGFPALQISQARIVMRPNQKWFHYMALSDIRQRNMPVQEDRSSQRSQPLAYREAVRLTNPIEKEFKGEVDDKYEYSGENKDIQVHGWICKNRSTGFWLITPSNEFRSGGPTKQNLLSHIGPTSNVYFTGSHYLGMGGAEFGDGEKWSKVLGPIFVHFNSVSNIENWHMLWENAKKQLTIEERLWPYSFIASKDFLLSNQRGSLRGKLIVHQRYPERYVPANQGYVGLAAPGEVGSWQTQDFKGYQFWTKMSKNGKFTIKNILPGEYDLYGWVPGVLGDYQHNMTIIIRSGSKVKMGSLIFDPPRDGPTLWEIGIPDRSAAEFFIPSVDPMFVNHLYLNHERFRQYGLWKRYSELYPKEDLIYTVGKDDYSKRWFFAQVTREVGNRTEGTTWQIRFTLDRTVANKIYTLRLAIAGVNYARLEVQVNNRSAKPVLNLEAFGRDNSIARHGAHGLYTLIDADLPGSILLRGPNTIFLTQSRGIDIFEGLMYDYIRLEGPSS